MSADTVNIYMQAFLIILSVIAAFSAVLGITAYVFQAIGLYSISRRRGLGTSGFAWVPILNWFKFGQIADDAVYHKNGRRPHFLVFYPVTFLAGFIILATGGFVASTSVHFSAAAMDQIQRGNMEAFFSRGFARIASQSGFTIGIILFLVGTLLLLICSVLQYICLYHIYRSCSGKWVVMFVLSFVFQIVIPFFLFAIRKNNNPSSYFPVPPAAETGFGEGA